MNSRKKEISPEHFALALIAACATSITGCSVIPAMDEYATTHNLYGNLCEEFIEEGSEDEIVVPDVIEDDDQVDEIVTGLELFVTEGDIQDDKTKEANQEEAL